MVLARRVADGFSRQNKNTDKKVHGMFDNYKGGGKLCKETEREKTRDTGMVKAWWPSHIKLCMRD